MNIFTVSEREMKMAVDKIPADIKLHNRAGLRMVRSNIERGDTVTFIYENERRTVLVLENDGTHLKGIAKERGGDFRNYLFSKIISIQYAKPFVKAVPVTTVKLEMIPDDKPHIVASTVNRNIEFKNRKGDTLSLIVYHDGSSNVYRNGNTVRPFSKFLNDQPFDMFVCISNFLSE